MLYPATHVQSLRLWTSVYLSNNSSFAGPEDTTAQITAPAEGAADGAPGLQKTRSCENILMLSEMNTSLSRRKSDPNIAMDLCDQQTRKLLKDAIGGDTSCSSESVKSSENDRSLSENGEGTVNGLDSPQRTEEKEVVENGGAASSEEEKSSVTNGDNCDNGETEPDNEHNDPNTQQIESEKKEENAEKDNTANGKVEVNGEANGASKNPTDLDSGENAVAETNLPNGLPSTNRDCLNGNGTHEMNGHEPDNPNSRTDSPASTNDSSENSIETISEGEEGDGLVNGANNHVNGENHESSKHSHNRVTNGFCNGDNRDIDTRIISMKLRQRNTHGARYMRSLESSTDTVIDDLQNGDSNHTITPSNSQPRQVQSLQTICNNKVRNDTFNTISISTSTSDLTDSRIHERYFANGLPGESLLNVGETLHASLKLPCILSQTALSKVPNGVYRGMHIDTSVASSLQPTPVSPQSRNSTCPPTPGTSDGRVSLARKSDKSTN